MEILSPASNMEHIKVAIDEKSNAVYGGVKKWNARNKAINFSIKEYNALITELHKNNIKFYLTLNILMLDDEIDEVVEFLKNNKLPDAFIVADIGLISVLKREFPDVPLHFSTQFGAHNIDDVNFIESLGGERAVLARELTLDETNKIKEKSNIELECFIWGSQCLSFSGLCFFGTLINGGGGNRGKCIITCRDVYSINNKKGHYLYVPDMDCINLISKMDGIDCLKIEGRRRNPTEIKQIIKKNRDRETSIFNAGYLFGTNINDNNLSEKINSRIKPILKSNELKDITDNDVFIKFKDDRPIEFSRDFNDENVKYVYTEINKLYLVDKMNISLDLSLENGIIKEVLYLNHKGTGNTFFCEQNDLIKVDFKQLLKEIEIDTDINLYKIKYKRDNNPIMISKNSYKEIIKYIKSDCIKKSSDYYKKIKIKKLYVETDSEEVALELIKNKDVKVIYNIKTLNKLKNIEELIKKLKDEVIYKFPLFNWKSDNMNEYYKKLNGKDVMFTRFSQLKLCNEVEFKKKYTDYTIYIWNKHSLKFLETYGITEFTGSPELSYFQNCKIFNNNKFQVIIGGKLPLVFTRGCFGNIYGCNNSCFNTNSKNIFNEDKKLEFEIQCNEDYRCIFYKYPILNDYSKVKVTSNTMFRYVTNNESIDEILSNIKDFTSNDYYNKLIHKKYWENSYECNLVEGRD